MATEGAARELEDVSPNDLPANRPQPDIDVEPGTDNLPHEESQPSLQDSLEELRAIENGAKEMDTNKAVELLASVVIALRKDSIVQKLIEYWDAKTQAEQLNMVRDRGAFMRFIEGIIPLMPLIRMPEDLRASFLKALLYYGVLQFNSTSEKAGGLRLVSSQTSETLVRELESQAKGAESFGLILVRGASFLVGQPEFGEATAILARLFEKNRQTARLVRVEVHQHDRMMAELAAAKDRRLPKTQSIPVPKSKQAPTHIRLAGDKTA